MSDALEDHEDTVSIRGRTVTHLRFPDDIDSFSRGGRKTVNIHRASRRSLYILRHGEQCREDKAAHDDHTQEKNNNNNNKKLREDLCYIVPHVLPPPLPFSTQSVLELT